MTPTGIAGTEAEVDARVGKLVGKLLFTGVHPARLYGRMDYLNWTM